MYYGSNHFIFANERKFPPPRFFLMSPNNEMFLLMKVPGEAIPNAQNEVKGFVFFHLWSVGDQTSQKQSSKSGTVCCCAG